MNAGDLWTGGLETVVTTLRWALIYFVHYPRVQKRVQAELDAVVGRRPLSLADRPNTPYFRATLDELQRLVNVLPWHIPHTAEKEVGKTRRPGCTLQGADLSLASSVPLKHSACAQRLHFRCWWTAC